MLKNIFIYTLLFSSVIISQDFSGIRIYINPGHGGYDSNDRYISETGFWESDGNLGKGLHLKEILESLGATVGISRTTNTTNDDLGLSVIAGYANNFDADYFHSIHSNGWQATSNYTLILFQGLDNAPTFAGAKEMGGYLATQIKTAHRTTAQYNRGDADFYGTGAPYLGVLKGLTMPGTLSEGSFHDYIPESWRLRNSSYLKHEAWAITKAFISYFGLTTLQYGEIAGVLRDPFNNVDYYYISSTSDSKKPLNFVQATLLPDNKLHLGDALNNGFFMFDKVPVGTYDLILVAEDHEPDTVYNVTVIANKTTFVDRDLIPKPNYSAPIVNSFTPIEEDNVRLDSDIIFEFNVKMNQVAVEQAFSISPNVVGTFTWESNDRILIFSPSEFLQGGTDYQVGFNIFAKSAYNVFFEQPFSKSFSTRSALMLVDAYPSQESNDISTTVKIKLSFDAPIDYSTLGGNIFFQDMNFENIDIFLDENNSTEGRIIFEPQNPLDYNTNFQVKLSSGLKDTDGSNLISDTTIVFTTESLMIKEGNSIEDFEVIGDWWQPEESGSTVAINEDETSFNISTSRSVNGESSGRLIYEFSDDSSGVCRVYNETELSLNSISNNYFGMWVFGDLSYNILEYWFRDAQETNIPIVVDTLNWTGWKFKEIDLSTYSDLKLHSLVISQNKNGQNSGDVYFDAILSEVITDIDLTISGLPTKFNLDQNYPNPFNPSTMINYSIPRISSDIESIVQLNIFDVLGQHVQTLVNKVQLAGNYNAMFNASSLPSGVYYYQLKIGKYSQSKKMLLLK